MSMNKFIFVWPVTQIRQHMTDPEIWKEAGAAGMLCLDTPSEYGGIGADFTFCAVAAEEQGPDIKFYSIYECLPNLHRALFEGPVMLKLRVILKTLFKIFFIYINLIQNTIFRY